MAEKQTETALSSDATEVRAQKLKLLREKIGDVYPAHFHRTMTNADLAEKYKNLEADVETQDVVTVAGRVYSSRNSGMFIDLRDASGKIQIFSHKDFLSPEQLQIVRLLDLGDLIGVEGLVRRTPRGELTVNARHVTVLSKALLPLPEKFHGLTDIETRYRQRYLDLIMNPESRRTLEARSRIVAAMRAHL
ncbi:MAG TPA: OB-fold nucleic acid binding domain-containing protein, partial [Pseudorhizobium sp.]|nr:OB-fold nucleic acid binding domain-containing protein [Pseudorhizobium sp.]